MTALPSPVAPAADGTIPFDLPCTTCGYNLRSRTLESVCPECGSPTRRTFLEGWLVFADRQWLRSLLTGVRIILWSSLAAIIAFSCLIVALIIGVDARWEPDRLVIAGVALSLAACGTIVWLAAVWFLTAPRPRGPRRRPSRRSASAKWILGLTCCPPVALSVYFVLVGQMFLSDGTPSVPVIVASMAANIVGSCAATVSIVLLMLHLRRIVRHELKQGLRKILTFMIWGILAMAGITVVYCVFIVFLVCSIAGVGPPVVVTAPATPKTGPITVSVATPGPTTAPVAAGPAPMPFGSPLMFSVIIGFGCVVEILVLAWCVCAVIALFWLRGMLLRAIDANMGDAFLAPMQPAPLASPVAPPTTSA